MKKVLCISIILLTLLFSIGKAIATDITFGWDKYNDPTAIGFYLKYSLISVGPYKKIADITNTTLTSFTLGNVEGTVVADKIYFLMTAYNADHIESIDSNGTVWTRPTTTTTSSITPTTSIPTTTTTSVIPPPAPITGLSIIEKE